MEENFDNDVQELDDQQLEEISGGRGRKLLCPRGTRKVCGTFDGVYKCICMPLQETQPTPAPEPQQ